MTEKQLEFLKETNRDNLLGRYITRMQERIGVAATEEEKRMLEEALKSGVEALLGGEGGTGTNGKEESP